MIARIRGMVVEGGEKGIVVETGGVGYFVYTPFTRALGEEVLLYTHMVVRADAQELYGFSTREEKELFSKLIGVSGVGPRTALQIVSLYPLPTLVGLIRNGDAKAIAQTPGVGKKTAEKIVIDLKDKLDTFSMSEDALQKSDLVEALLSLGYKEIHIRSVLSEVATDVPIEKQITTALQLLQK